MAEYAHPESLASTQWVAEHGNDANLRLVEVDVDTSAYEQGHIAGAVGWNWQSQLQQTVRRNIISREEMEGLLGNAGIDNDTTVILYGDNNNWFAGLGLLADEVLRPPGRSLDERRKGQVGWRRTGPLPPRRVTFRPRATGPASRTRAFVPTGTPCCPQ